MTTSDVITRYGPMRVINEDPWVSRSLIELGEYSESEVGMVRRLIHLISRDHPITFVDAGAYIGDLTIPISREVRWVYAFEPQHEVREVLEYNLSANGVTNVTVFPFALGHRCEEIAYTPNPQDGSFGGVQMADPTGSCSTRMVTLDSLGLDVDFIKADVEGMEVPLLSGAMETIARCRPVLFCEFDTVFTPSLPQLNDAYEFMGYDCLPMSFYMWNVGNYNHCPSNPFGETVSFMKLGVPRITHATRTTHTPA